MIAVIDTTNTPSDEPPYLGELIESDAPSVEELNRLAVVLAAMRAVLNDPEALMRRAAELLDGTAKPLFVAAFVSLGVMRMVAGPSVPGYLDLPRHRSTPVVIAVPVKFDVA